MLSQASPLGAIACHVSSEAGSIAMHEVSALKFPVNKEVMEYMLILKEKFPQSI